ncbi:MAG: GNVR domain-containing protein [Acidobacteriota bacterium]|jgi:polysaccharide chain length determinant protein (PEP-CTERM system associated)
MDTSALIGTYTRMAWRKRWYLVIPLILCLAGAFAVLKLVPPEFMATTVILVQPPNIPSEYVKPTATTSIEGGMKTIQQQVTSRTRLETVARDLNLFPQSLDARMQEQRIEDMQKRISLRTKERSSFAISYRSGDPVLAARIANRLADLFIEANAQTRQEEARNTSEFLGDELERIRGELVRQEAAIAEFKRKNQAELPQQQDANLRTLEGLQRDLRDNQLSLERARDRRTLLQAQMGSMERFELGEVESADPDDPRVQLMKAKKDLAELRLRYTDRYPDVQQLQARVDALQKEVASLPADSDAPPGVLLNPAFERLQTEVQAIDLEISQLEEEIDRIKEDVARYRARVENAPSREQELLSLTRDYNTLESKYQDLLRKKTDAEIAETLERERQGEQFVVLDRARPPATPYRPDPIQTIAVGILLGLAIGGGIVALQEVLRPTFYAPQQVQEATGVPVLAAVPIIKVPRRRRAAAKGGS